MSKTINVCVIHELKWLISIFGLELTREALDKIEKNMSESKEYRENVLNLNKEIKK